MAGDPSLGGAFPYCSGNGTLLTFTTHRDRSDPAPIPVTLGAVNPLTSQVGAISVGTGPGDSYDG